MWYISLKNSISSLSETEPDVSMATNVFFRGLIFKAGLSSNLLLGLCLLFLVITLDD
jgi:hypothetical protein